jgi:hypothetical protein
MDTKPIWMSKTVWGAGVAILASIAGLFGYTFSPADQSVLVELVTTVLTAGGGLLAVYGRVVATKPISRKGK